MIQAGGLFPECVGSADTNDSCAGHKLHKNFCKMKERIQNITEFVTDGCYNIDIKRICKQNGSNLGGKQNEERLFIR